MSVRPRLAPSLALAAALAAALVSGGPRAAAEDGEVSRPRMNLSPSYTAGQRFRLERRFRQVTVTGVSQGRGRGGGPVNFSDYDAGLEVHATVKVESVTDTGEASVWEAHFDRVRVDVPDPIQSQEYRLRQRERKSKGLPADAHPLEGKTVKCDVSGKKAKIYRVTKKGADHGITQRYPEIVPLMQDLVEPDWVPVDTVPVGGSWEMEADHIFRLTKVLAKAPLEGRFRCKLVEVKDDVARIELAAALSETYAKVEMAIEGSGFIEFDVRNRRLVSSRVKGHVSITSPGSSLKGMGTIVGETQWSVAPPDAGEETDDD
jgi:hypothetical protein